MSARGKVANDSCWLFSSASGRKGQAGAHTPASGFPAPAHLAGGQGVTPDQSNCIFLRGLCGCLLSLVGGHVASRVIPLVCCVSLQNKSLSHKTPTPSKNLECKQARGESGSAGLSWPSPGSVSILQEAHTCEKALIC